MKMFWNYHDKCFWYPRVYQREKRWGSGKGCVVDMIRFTKKCETLKLKHSPNIKIIITLENIQMFKGIKGKKGCLSVKNVWVLKI